MKKRNIVYIFIFLFSLLCISCRSNIQPEEPLPPLEEYFQYHYTDEEVKTLSTNSRTLDKSLIHRTGYSFQGVYNAPNGNGIQYFTSEGNLIEGMQLTSNLDLYVKWEIKTYSLIFISDGQTFKTESFAYGSNLSIADVPEKTGYSFTGWADRKGTLFTNEIGYYEYGKSFLTVECGYTFNEKENSVLLYATYDINKYKVTYDYNGKGENEETIVPHGSSLSLPKVENDYENYEFFGWSYTNSTAEPQYYTKEEITKDLTLYAIWIPFKTFTFKKGNDVIYSVRVYNDGSTKSISDLEENFQLDGYDFKGCYKNSSFSGSSKVTTFFYGTAETEFYLDYMPITYTLTLSCDDKTIIENEKLDFSYTIEDEIELPKASKENYIFIGWCLDSELNSEPIQIFKKGNFGDITLYPKFRGEDRAVVYNAKEGILGSNYDIVEFGTSFQLKVPNLSGYAFDGWYVLYNNEEIKLTDGTGASIIDWFITEKEIIVYAQYLQKHSITIVVNNSNMGSVYVKEYYVKGDEVTLVASCTAGYYLEGFYVNNSLLGEDGYKFIMGEEDLLISAIFAPKQYVLTLNPSGGMLETPTIEVTFGENVSLPIPVRARYTFEGWKYNETIYKESLIWNYAFNTEFKAIWTEVENSYEIKTVKDLLAIANNPSAHYFLSNDLDLKGIDWKGFEFKGILNGLNHAIKGLSNPLFSVLSGQVYNLSISVDIKHTNNSNYIEQIGGLAVRLDRGIIHDVVVEGSILANGGSMDTGGIVGDVYGEASQIYNCLNKANISGVNASLGGSTGGIVGAVHDPIRFEKNVNEGDVTSNNIVAGMVGYYGSNKKKLDILECTNKGNITGTGHSIGGIMGCSSAPSKITRCKMLGTSTHGKYAGDNNVTYELDPIEVYTSKDLLGLYNHISIEQYLLMNDIDMMGMAWNPFAFTAILNGNGHSISNLSIVSDNVNSGIFTNISGKITNLTLENINVKSTSISLVNIGGLCGELTGHLENITIFGEISAEFANIGGLVGKMTDGSILNCINNAIVIGSSIETGANAGGLVGKQTAGSISGCKNYGEIFNKYNAGGIIGYLNSINITNLSNYGKVNGDNNIGGIVGYLDKGGTYTITELNNYGLINGTNHVGGIIGYHKNYVELSNYSKGTYTETMTKVKNSGTITGTNYVGGIIGYAHLNGYAHNGNVTVAISASNWENVADITGTSYVGGLLGYGYSNHTDSKISLGTSRGTITAEYYIGGLAGKLEYIQLYNCSNENTQIKATGYLIDGSNSYAYVGGYAGYGYTIEECVNSIEILYTERGSYVGGLIGYSNGQIRNCTNNANITATKSNDVGGLIGYRTHGGTYTETGLENIGSVSGANYVGGIIGYHKNYVELSNYSKGTYTETMTKVKNSGTITGTNYVGGIIGYAHLNGYAHNGNVTVAISASNWENVADITGTSYVGGLLGYGYSNHTDSKISLGTSRGTITAEYYIGGLAGKLEYIQLYNCSNENTQIKATGYLIDGSNSYAYVGGYAGYGYTIEECVNSIEILYTERGSYVGGLIGYSNGQIRNCTNNANITATKSNDVGGLIGYRTHGGTYTETGLENIGSVSGANYVGGIIGYHKNYVELSNYSKGTYTETMTKVKNSGTITGTNYVGGIIGYAHLNGYAHNGNVTVAISASNWENVADITGTSYVGGLLGYGYSNHTDSKISLGTSRGTITAEYYIGGLAGKLEYIQLYNCSNENTQIKATGYLIDGSNSYAYVGGYAGYGYTIEECVNSIEILYTERGSYVGGLIGYSNGQIRNCTNNANITATKSNDVGGLIGYRTHGGTYTETGLENIGSVSGANYVGGIIGYHKNYVELSNYSKGTYTETMTKVKNSGTITGTNYVGGIIGYAHLNGYAHNGNVTVAISASNWENVADITGTSYVGGLLGYGYSNHSSSIMVDYTQTGVVIGSGESVDDLIGSNTNINLLQ